MGVGGGEEESCAQTPLPGGWEGAQMQELLGLSPLGLFEAELTQEMGSGSPMGRG